MKYLLIFCFLFLSIACRKSNSTSADPSLRNYPFDNAVFLRIDHKEEQSVLRKKLLNLALTKELKLAKEVNPELEIKNDDEFLFNDMPFEMSSLNMEEYKNNLTNSAKVTVSYNDHLEIYFVPSGIDRQKAINQLGIVADPEATFSWVQSADDKLEKNKSYYLLSSSSYKRKENDVYFNQEKKSLGNSFNEMPLVFSRNQIVEFEISTEYSLRETTFTPRNGRSRRCEQDREIGPCERCTYMMETTTGNLNRQVLENTELLDFEIIINSNKYHLNQLSPVKLLNGNFKVILDLKKLVQSETALVQFHQNSIATIIKTVASEQFTKMCSGDNHEVQTINITPVLNINIDLDIKGRNFNQ